MISEFLTLREEKELYAKVFFNCFLTFCIMVHEILSRGQMDGHTGGDMADKGFVYVLANFTETVDLQRNTLLAGYQILTLPVPAPEGINQTRGFPTREVQLLQSLLKLLFHCTTLFT